VTHEGVDFVDSLIVIIPHNNRGQKLCVFVALSAFKEKNGEFLILAVVCVPAGNVGAIRESASIKSDIGCDLEI
jgi:hypothetical protein